MSTTWPFDDDDDDDIENVSVDKADDNPDANDADIDDNGEKEDDKDDDNECSCEDDDEENDDVEEVSEEKLSNSSPLRVLVASRERRYEYFARAFTSSMISALLFFSHMLHTRRGWW